MPLKSSHDIHEHCPDYIPASSSVLWPLTRRGLFSELLVYSYVKANLERYGKRMTLVASLQDYSYWRSILPHLYIRPTVFPSYLISPVIDSPSTRIMLKAPIAGKYFQPKLLFQHMWRPETEEKIRDEFDLLTAISVNIASALAPYLAKSPQVIDGIPFGTAYNVVHVRRGDKIYNSNPEARLYPLAAYRDLGLRKLDRCLPLVLLGDSTQDILELSEMLLAAGFQSVQRRTPLLSTGADGYDQTRFNRLHTSQRSSYNLAFIDDFMLMVNARQLICSYSSCVGRSAGILRRTLNTYSVDTDFTIVQ
jgi:hypothetical protein